MRIVLVAILVSLLWSFSAKADFFGGLRAYDSGDYAQAAAEWEAAANAGNREAQYRLGQLYEEGLGVPQNFVTAHAWYNLASALGSEQARQARDRLAETMTPAQFAQAQDLALARWRERSSPGATAGSLAPPQRAAAEPASPASRLQDLLRRTPEPGRDLATLAETLGRTESAVTRAQPSPRAVEPDQLTGVVSEIVGSTVVVGLTVAAHPQIGDPVFFGSDIPQPGAPPPSADWRVHDLDAAGVSVMALGEDQSLPGIGTMAAVFSQTPRSETQFARDLAILSAVQSGDATAVRQALREGGNVNAVWLAGSTPIGWAARTGDPELVRVILEAGAEVDTEADGGQTPLGLAAFEGHTEVVRELLAAGVPVNRANKRGSNDIAGATALLLAARNNHVDTIETLIELGANIDARNDAGDNAVSLAAAHGAAQAILALTRHGADVDGPNKAGVTPIMLAVLGGEDAVLAVLAQDPSLDNTFPGTDADDELDGHSALMAAASLGEVNIVRFLLAAGADRSIATVDGATALTISELAGHVEISELLREPGEARTSTSAYLDQSLIAAVRDEDEARLDFLLRVGASPNAVAGRDGPVLLGAVEGGIIAILDLLLEAGARVNEAASRGETALMVAAFFGQTEVVERLLVHGAHVDQGLTSDVDEFVVGTTALIIAASAGHVPVVDQLLRAGADVALQDGQGRNALDIARAQDRQKVADLLAAASVADAGDPEQTPLWQAPARRLVVEAEPNNSADVATQAAARDVLQGSIAERGDADWYQVAFGHPGELRVATDAAPGALDLAFRLHADGKPLSGWIVAPGDGEPVAGFVDVSKAGEYWLEIRDGANSAASADPYRLALTYSPTPDRFEPNNTAETATQVSATDNVLANILPLGDADWFLITTEEHGELRLQASDVPPELDIAFRVFDDDQQALGGWLTADDGPGSNTTAVVDLPTPGRYRIEVRDGANNARSAEPFSLATVFTPSADRFEPNQSAEEAASVPLAGEFQATILPRGDADWYRLDSDDQGELRLEITDVAPEIDVFVRAFMAEGGQVAGWIGPEGPGAPTTAIIDLPTKGAYLLEIRDGSNNARSVEPFTVTSTFAPTRDVAEPNQSAEEATQLELNTQVTASIFPLHDQDWFVVGVDEAGPHVIDIRDVPTGLDIYYRIHSPEGAVLQGWTGPAETGADRQDTVEFPAPGRYRIQVSDGSNNARSADSYSLMVRHQ